MKRKRTLRNKYILTGLGAGAASGSMYGGSFGGTVVGGIVGAGAGELFYRYHKLKIKRRKK